MPLRHLLIAGGSSVDCWGFNNGINYSASAAVTEGLACFEVGGMSVSGDDSIHCYKPEGSAGFSYPLFVNQARKLTGGVKSIALGRNQSTHATHLFVLGNDNVVRSGSGDTSTISAFLAASKLHNLTVDRRPVDIDTGAQLTLAKIVARNPYNWYTVTLAALGANGVAYQAADGTDGTRGWRRVRNVDSKFPTTSWSDVSPGDTGVGVAGLNAEGTRTYLSHHSPSTNWHWIDHPWSARYPNAALALGWPYLITNVGRSTGTCDTGANTCSGDEHRVYRYNSGAWSVFPGAMPGFAQSWPKNRAIVNAYRFRGRAGEFFIHNTANRWFAWIP